MIYRGHIKNGAIVLEDQISLPEGAKVSVQIEPTEALAETDVPKTLYERLKGVIGCVDDLPADAAINHS